MRRLDVSRINIAIFEDGSMRVLVTEPETVSVIVDGGTVYSPADMYAYITLTEGERRMLHQFKKRFGGTTHWRAV